MRELTRRHGVLLAFDEVKTGLTVGPGGATALFGVQPDIVCLAKAMGGGIPCGAIGGTDEVMEAIADGTYEQVGTFNGNPLTMAAARATLTEVLVPSTYERFDVLGRRMLDGAMSALHRIGVPVYGHRFGAKGCLVFAAQPVRDYREFLAVDGNFSHAHWLDPAQRRRVPAAVGQERAVDAVGPAQPRRRRPLRGQRRAHDERARPPRLLDARPHPPRLLLASAAWVAERRHDVSCAVATQADGEGASGRRRDQAGVGTLRRWGRLKADSAMPSSSAAAART